MASSEVSFEPVDVVVADEPVAEPLEDEPVELVSGEADEVEVPRELDPEEPEASEPFEVFDDALPVV